MGVTLWSHGTDASHFQDLANLSFVFGKGEWARKSIWSEIKSQALHATAFTNHKVTLNIDILLEISNEIGSKEMSGRFLSTRLEITQHHVLSSLVVRSLIFKSV